MSVLLFVYLNLALWRNWLQELDAFTELFDDCLLSVLVGICLALTNLDGEWTSALCANVREFKVRKMLLIEISIMIASANCFAQIDRCLLILEACNHAEFEHFFF